MPDKKLHVPYDFIDDLSHAGSLEAVLDVGARWLPHVLPALRSSICFCDGTRMIGKVHRTDGQVDVEIAMDEIRPGMLRHGVMADGQPRVYRFEEEHPDQHFELRALYRNGFRTTLLAPMTSNGRIVGTLSASHAEPDTYQEFEIRRMTAFGKLIASKGRLMQAARDSVRQAETDRLTGLANRTRLMKVLEGPGKLNLPDSRGWVLGVLHIDLDHFKEVNDTLGHAVGDLMLQHAARIMTETVGPKDLVARIGGDEFVVVTRSDREGAHIGKLGAQLVNAMTEPLIFEDLEVRVGASIGTALVTSDAYTAERLISNADLALYAVKRAGRGGVRAFCGKIRDESARRSQLLSDLIEAVEARAFEPLFQPLLTLETGAFRGFELVARWLHPLHGTLDYAALVELSEEAGQQSQFDEALRHKGLDAMQALVREGWAAPRMCLNLSERSLAEAGLRERLLAELRARDLRPQDLFLEVSESDLRGLGPDQAAETLEQLTFAGFPVALDEFGTGLANLAALSSVALSGIKIDASLVALLPGDRAEVILRAAITLAHDLGMTVAAFGIETAEQYATLLRLGCDGGQGGFIAGPLTLSELRGFMGDRRAASEPLGRGRRPRLG